MDKNINIIRDLDGKRFVLINDIRFKGKRKDFPDEYANSESRIQLKGAVAKAKANASQAIPEMIRIATNPSYKINIKKKHENDAKYGWYRYEVRFALPVYDDIKGVVVRYNIYRATMLVRHAEDNKKYLYDFISIKKETSSPLK